MMFLTNKRKRLIISKIVSSLDLTFKQKGLRFNSSQKLELYNNLFKAFKVKRSKNLPSYNEKYTAIVFKKG